MPRNLGSCDAREMANVGTSGYSRHDGMTGRPTQDPLLSRQIKTLPAAHGLEKSRARKHSLSAA
jgi:hypothetical protein